MYVVLSFMTQVNDFVRLTDTLPTTSGAPGAAARIQPSRELTIDMTFLARDKNVEAYWSDPSANAFRPQVRQLFLTMGICQMATFVTLGFTTEANQADR